MNSGPMENVEAPDLGTPGVMGMRQAPELRGLGSREEPVREDWRRWGLRAWGGRRNCQGSDPAGTISMRSGNPRGSGHGAVAGTARAWTHGERSWGGRETSRGRGQGAVAGTARARTDEEPVPPGRGLDMTRNGGTG